jgi:DNA-binding CsgD family transcriptional regulator
MKLRLVLADISRWIARIIALPIVLLIFFMIYVGFAIARSEPSAAGGNPWLSLVTSLPLLGVSVGLILAYWNEKTGSIVGFVSFPALFTMIWWAFLSLEDMLEGLSSFALLLVPIGLFFASWLLRRKHQIEEREMPPKPLAGLPDEEKEVLHLLSEGLPNLEIADRLGISGVQASLTTSELLKRFGVDNKDELVNQARQQGYLPPN